MHVGSKRGLLTLPVLLVAIAALTLGSVGTATAGGLTVHAVKKIAAKVVKKKAKTLTVANAATATTATTASTATTAATAGNASNLGGQPASTYLNRVAFGTGSFGQTVTGATAELATAAMTIPAGVNFVHVQGRTSFVGGNTTVAVFLAPADTLCSAADTLYAYGSSSPTQQSISDDQVFAATPGVHTYRFCGLSGTSSDSYNATITVETAQLGSSGTSALAKPSVSRHTDTDGDPSTPQ